LSAVSFIAGVVCALACLVLLLPWLRTVPGLSTLPSLPWPAGAGALVIIVVTIMLLRATNLTPTEPTAGSAGNSVATQNSWADVADALNHGVARADMTGSAPVSAPAGSMDTAIMALQARLAKGGGGNDDWELLAKSYEFLGRPQQASQARAHQLPASNAAVPTAVTGEVTLAAALAARATAGATLFIIAKSVDSPGAPLAVYRGSVATWPMTFNLDDSESMLPGRNLSSAGRITVEARISQSGQALAAAGDLQGVSGIINPRDHKPVTIVIDKVIS
jgi:hypothetical protein